MKRFCIFVTYDIENIADDYIGHMLQEMRKVTDFLVVVCNYGHIARGMENIQSYADKIFYRENKGFDVGAYKEVLCQYLNWDEVCKYDELVLINDSFYGPFYSFEDLFERIEDMDIDYWGLTRSPKGKLELANGCEYSSHIQSYFFAFRRNVLINKEFRLFWENMELPLSFSQAIISYEFGLNQLLQDIGFLEMTVMDMHEFNIAENENPYLAYPYELIRDAKIPIFKRKSLSLRNKRFDNVIEALKYIENESNYDINLIFNHLSRIGKGVSIIGLDRFYATYKKIYIYGAGLYGRNLAKYFAYKGWVFEKFLVTRLEKASEECISFDNANITKNDGIIIAVGDENEFMDILKLVQKRCSKNQIFNSSIMW